MNINGFDLVIIDRDVCSVVESLRWGIFTIATLIEQLRSNAYVLRRIHKHSINDTMSLVCKLT